MDTKLPSVNTSVLPVLRRYAKHAYLLHGYLIACLILLPTYRSPSYSQDAGSYEEPSIPTEPPPQADPPPAEPTPEPAPDPSTMDSDGDHLSDAAEASYGTNPYNPDTDYDGITDADEINVTGTSPTMPDSNWNGVSDYNEFYGNYTVTADYNSGVNTTDPNQTTTQEYFSSPSPVDFDQDGIEDHLDPDPYSANNIPDQDGDYVPDNQDSDPSTSWLWNDWNRNGTNDDAEYVAPDPSPTTTETYTPPENPDHDADGIANETDSHPWDSMLFNDWNFNGSNDQDEDWDGDGVANLQDSHPNSNILWCDWNQNNVNDDAEAALSDSDGDGHLDHADSHSHNSALWSDWNGNGTNDESETVSPPDTDSDGDGTLDSSDSHPSDSNLWEDWNGNGTNDSSETTTPSDNDSDGTPDGSDSHPSDSNLWEDWNGNGTNDSSETTTPSDNDSDGTPDGSDSHPYNSSLWEDWNGNGTNDSTETAVLADSDGDGTYDDVDTDPQNPQLWNDQNRNGQNDQNEVIITDNDADGYANDRDTHPDDSGRWNDHNNDGFNDEQQAPPDSDGDGISDDQDSFPHDFDNDGISDLDELNAGTNPGTSDTDNDGVTDAEEAYAGSNPNQVDSDGDGLTDSEELLAYNTAPTQTTTIVGTQSEADAINTAPGGVVEMAIVTPLLPTEAPSPPAPPSIAVTSTLPPASPPPSQIATPAPAPAPTQLAQSTLKGVYLEAFKGAALYDTDGDTIPDIVEDMYAPFMNKSLSTDGQGDLDADGITNAAEYALGSDLRGNTIKSDWDGDGVSNILEDQHSPMLSKLNFSDAFNDPDGDGLLNIEELNKLWHVAPAPKILRNGVQVTISQVTDPLVANSHMVIWYSPNQNPYFMFNRGEVYEATSVVSRWASGTDKTKMTELLHRYINSTPLNAATYYDAQSSGFKNTFGHLILLARLNLRAKDKVDRDSDGIPTLWEAHYQDQADYRDPTDAALDGDPMKPVPERAVKRPTGTTTAAKAAQAKWDLYTKVDPDNDGMCNLLEYQLSTHPGFSEGSGDLDGDGYSNRTELSAGSDAGDVHSLPNLEIILSGGGQVGPAGTPLPLAITALVKVDGLPKPNFAVYFRSRVGRLRAVVSSDDPTPPWLSGIVSQTTDSDGFARVEYQLPPTAGTHSIEAWHPGPDPLQRVNVEALPVVMSLDQGANQVINSGKQSELFKVSLTSNGLPVNGEVLVQTSSSRAVIFGANNQQIGTGKATIETQSGSASWSILSYGSYEEATTVSFPANNPGAPLATIPSSVQSSGGGGGGSGGTGGEPAQDVVLLTSSTHLAEGSSGVVTQLWSSHDLWGHFYSRFDVALAASDYLLPAVPLLNVGDSSTVEWSSSYHPGVGTERWADFAHVKIGSHDGRPWRGKALRKTYLLVNEWGSAFSVRDGVSVGSVALDLEPGDVVSKNGFFQPMQVVGMTNPFPISPPQGKTWWARQAIIPVEIEVKRGGIGDNPDAAPPTWRSQKGIVRDVVSLWDTDSFAGRTGDLKADWLQVRVKIPGNIANSLPLNTIQWSIPGQANPPNNTIETPKLSWPGSAGSRKQIRVTVGGQVFAVNVDFPEVGILDHFTWAALMQITPGKGALGVANCWAANRIATEWSASYSGKDSLKNALRHSCWISYCASDLFCGVDFAVLLGMAHEHNNKVSGTWPYESTMDLHNNYIGSTVVHTFDLTGNTIKGELLTRLANGTLWIWDSPGTEHTGFKATMKSNDAAIYYQP